MILFYWFHAYFLYYTHILFIHVNLSLFESWRFSFLFWKAFSDCGLTGKEFFRRRPWWGTRATMMKKMGGIDYRFSMLLWIVWARTFHTSVSSVFPTFHVFVPFILLVPSWQDKERTGCHRPTIFFIAIAFIVFFRLGRVFTA